MLCAFWKTHSILLLALLVLRSRMIFLTSSTESAGNENLIIPLNINLLYITNAWVFVIIFDHVINITQSV